MGEIEIDEMDEGDHDQGLDQGPAIDPAIEADEADEIVIDTVGQEAGIGIVTGEGVIDEEIEVTPEADPVVEDDTKFLSNCPKKSVISVLLRLGLMTFNLLIQNSIVLCWKPNNIFKIKLV